MERVQRLKEEIPKDKREDHLWPVLLLQPRLILKGFFFCASSWLEIELIERSRPSAV